MNPAIPYLLLVEDEPTQRQILTEYLSRQGLRVAAVADGRTMRETLELEIPQLLLLDVGLPGEDGFVLARWLRERHPGVGIIMVTGASDSVDRIVGLETGADDYVTKPYDPRELLARIKSVLRRTLSHVHRAVSNEPVHESPPIALGRCTFDRERRILLAHDGTEKPLTATEFDLLDLFCNHPNRPLSREWLLETTSQRDYDGSDRSIDLRITRLRRKIELNADRPKILRTVRGVGYMLVLEKL
ncbi:MAG: response regulator transcription factor [Burkholderiales bacterium]|jgi:DNA-binding response OmpR family regulator|nr:response regulator transcription factor [Burkholderiales bacterium]